MTADTRKMCVGVCNCKSTCKCDKGHSGVDTCTCMCSSTHGCGNVADDRGAMAAYYLIYRSIHVLIK